MPKLFVFTFLCLFLTPLYGQEEDTGVWQKVSHNVRVMKNQDGSVTRLRRSADQTAITKRTIDANGTLTMTTIYRLDGKGNLHRCMIYDGKGTLLYKVAYGYHKKNGRLVAEDMFDARAMRKDPKTGKETPVRRIYYQYDAQGNQTKPVSVVFVNGKLAEELYTPRKSSYLHENPFEKE